MPLVHLRRRKLPMKTKLTQREAIDLDRFPSYTPMMVAIMKAFVAAILLVTPGDAFVPFRDARRRCHIFQATVSNDQHQQAVVHPSASDCCDDAEIFDEKDHPAVVEPPLSSNNAAAQNSSHNVPNNNKTPRHIAFICDGNSRWAKARNLPAVAGHTAGAERVWDLLQALGAHDGITHCTLYTFSTENWQRPAAELQHLWTIMERTARTLQIKNQDNAVCIRLLGDTDDARIPVSLRTLLRQLEEETAFHDETKLTLSLAINYGGRLDIVQAARKLVASSSSSLDPDSITEDTISALLGTSGIPDPDLIVRTSGETRLSNFMLWNAAYAELYFTATLWPDFGPEALNDALEWYRGRKRRFGGRTTDDEDQADAHAHDSIQQQ